MPVIVAALVSLVALLPATMPSAPQEPLRLGVIARDERGSADVPFVRGVRRAAEAVNSLAAGASGGVQGAKIELVFVPASTGREASAAVASLLEQGVAGLVLPAEAHLAVVAHKAAAGKLPCVRYDFAPADLARVVDELIAESFCMTQVGFVRDGQRSARDFAKLLQKGALTPPSKLLCEIDATISAKNLQKQFEKERPEVLVIDAEPDDAQRFLDMLGDDPIPVVLLPRAHDQAAERRARPPYVVQAVSVAATAGGGSFRRDYERDHGMPLFGAAEGFEAVTALARAFGAVPGREAAKVQAVLEGMVLEGARGRIEFDKKLSAFAPPLAVHHVVEQRLVPFRPGVVPFEVAEAGGTSAGGTAAGRLPQSGIGVPFGTWRTRRFAWEEGAQYVVCQWAEDSGFASIDDDLAQLGLSTRGKDPILDHLVKEEIMARVVAIASTKFLRDADGSPVDGKSIRICFGQHLAVGEREKKRLRLWPARFGGDHADAGGEAFGTYCRVYSSFIRRTIFQAHALDPAVGPGDRKYLDGSYVFGSDYDLDKRSELIRALVNGYAGAMALTLAHEVGHLTGLGHVTDDPKEIMNVNEGAGLDYPEANFGEPSLEHMRKRFGVSGETSARRR
jgi:hypothetical protein